MSPAGARLRLVAAPASPDGIVVVLHGGAGRGPDPVAVSPAQASVLRMVPVAWRAAAAGRGRLAVARLLNAHRGWHPARSPVADAHWAIDALAERFGERPVVLVGHSLGGRAAVVAAVDRPQVHAVVALAPWVHPGDGAGLTGRRVVVVHGDRDRVAPPARAAALVQQLRARNDATLVRLREAGHTLVPEHGLVDALAADVARTVLLGVEPRTALLRRVLAGADLVEVGGSDPVTRHE